MEKLLVDKGIIVITVEKHSCALLIPLFIVFVNPKNGRLKSNLNITFKEREQWIANWNQATGSVASLLYTSSANDT